MFNNRAKVFPLMSVFAFVLAAAALASGPEAVVTDPLEWLYADSRVKEQRTFSETDVPANGVAEANVLFNGLKPGENVSLRADCGDAEWFRLVDVPVEVNTGREGGVERATQTNLFVSRDAPFRVCDAMQPLADGAFVPTSSTAAVRLRLRRFGVREGCQPVRLTFAQDGFTADRTLKVNVHDADVPPVGRDSFRYTNWMNYDSMATCHGLKPGSPEHLDMIRRYVRLATYGRQNMALVPLYRDPRQMEAFVQLLTDAGVWYLEGAHLAGFSTHKWGAPAFVPRGSTNLTTSAKGAACLAQKATYVANVIRENGWTERWYQHVADEPSEHNIGEYRKTCGIVRKHMPGIRLTDAVESFDVAGALDAVCPKNRYYEENRAAFDALKTLPTDEIWCYTCMFPGGKWMNRLLDNELIRPVLLPWGCVRFSLDGYLHWGYNQFSPKNDPLRTSLSRDEHMSSNLPPGDRNIVYAGTDGPWPSVRLEAMRQGFEDLELLRILAKRNRTAADALVKRLVRGFADYETDAKAYWKTRRALLSAVAAKAPAPRAAEVKVARVFADNMVLQREKPVRIWGWAKSGAKVAVVFAGQRKETVAKEGKWSVTLDPLTASKQGRDLQVFGGGVLAKTISNVLVGEVWILSGQSNMQWGVQGTDDYTNVIRRANYPQMRYMFGQDGALATAPADDFPSVRWVETTTNLVSRYSATGFYFGERLMLDLDVPVGLVMTACGATSMANWTPYDWMKRLPYQKRYLERYERESAEWVRTNGFAGACARHMKAIEKYADDIYKAKTGKGKWPWPTPGAPLSFTGWRSNLVPAAHYNSKIAPLAGLACRGVLWYQGETEGWCWNESDPGWNFGDMLELMIRAWRSAWGEDIWFVIAQLPSMAANNHGRPVIRVKQLEVSKRLANVGVANITDTGWKDDVHPHDKKPVGERLARVARRRVYGDRSVALTPEFKSAAFAPGRAVVTFASETALRAQGEGVGRGFELKVAGKWRPAAKAELVGGKAVVSATNATDKVEGVRYLWDSWDKPNVWIYDEQGVPVNSFSDPFEIQ